MQNSPENTPEDTPASELAILHERVANGDGFAQSRLGMIYYWDYENYGLIRDELMAIKLWDSAVKQGDRYGYWFYALAVKLQIGGLKQDNQLIKSYAEKAKTKGLSTILYRHAKNGDCLYQYLVALCYIHGIMVKQSYPHAEKWLKKAMEKDFYWAHVELGMIYEKYAKNQYARPMSPYIEAAQKLHVIAIKKGNAGGQEQLAKLYEKIELKKNDFIPKYLHIEWAVKLYKMAAKQGHVDSQCALAEIYSGLHHKLYYEIPADLDQAVLWLNRALEQNSPRAKCAIGMMYEKGLHFRKNPELAKKHYLEAIEQGYYEGYNFLGHLFKKTSSPQAIKYFTQAAKNFPPSKEDTAPANTAKMIYEALQTRIKKADYVVCHMKREVNHDIFSPFQTFPIEIVELIMNYGELFTFHYYFLILKNYSEKSHLKRAGHIKSDIIWAIFLSNLKQRSAEKCVELRRALYRNIASGKLEGEPCQRHPFRNWLHHTQGMGDWKVEQDANGKVVDQFMFLLQNLHAAAPLTIAPSYSVSASPPSEPSLG